MGILNDLEQIGKDIEGDVEKIGATIEKDLDKAAQAVGNGVDKIKSFLVDGFDQAEQAIINKLTGDTLAKYAAEIKALRTLATGGIAGADRQSIVDDIEAVVGKADATSASALFSNLVTKTMQDAWQYLKTFQTLTFGCDGEIDLGIGVSASAGAGIFLASAADVSKSRILVDFMATAGVEEAADVGLCLGIWSGKPKDVGGGFIAVTVGADAGVGANVILYFSLSADPKFSGIVLDIVAGEDLEASIDCGYTLALPAPAGTLIQLAQS
jgi:hypothetical protein